MASSIDYAPAGVPVRADLIAAHRNAWQRLAEAGTWWSGTERVQIAAEVRRAWHCDLCQRRRGALSPYGHEGEHDSVAQLPGPAIEVVHRLTTDPGRLKKSWFDELAPGELSHGAYVELVSVVATVMCIDAFCRGVGVALHELPSPQPGEPSHYQPEQARMEHAWVPLIPQDGATGSEADLWDPAGTGNVIRALSLVPDAVRELKEQSSAHYLAVHQVRDPEQSRGALSRPQMELVASRVSALRECFY